MTIREHHLAWRWTGATHAVLPDDVLAQMQPIEHEAAKRLSQRTFHFVTGESLSPAEFARISRHDADLPTANGRQWLLEQQPDQSTKVFVLWDDATAIQTTWDIFTAYWDSFCYPASDDVVIWPESERWVLLYHHWDEFEFGWRTTG